MPECRRSPRRAETQIATEQAMAKGQKRSNREAKKAKQPKSEKAATVTETRGTDRASIADGSRLGSRNSRR